MWVNLCTEQNIIVHSDRAQLLWPSVNWLTFQHRYWRMYYITSHFHQQNYLATHTHTHPFKGPFSGPVRILLEQQTVSGSGISWAVCKSAPCSRQITMLAPHRSVFTGPVPFLLPNQQRQSTEGISYTSDTRLYSELVSNPDKFTVKLAAY